MIKELRAVPLKNYIILFAIAFLTVLLTFYIRKMVNTYNSEELSISPLHSNVSEVNTNELDLTLNESNQVILYVSYVNDASVYKMEKNLLSKIKSKNLSDYIIYYNITNENDYLDILKNKFKSIKNNIKKAPLLIYIKNGEGLEVINSTDQLIDVNDLSYLTSKYEIGK